MNDRENEKLKLTKTERKRKEKFEKIVTDMTGKGYECKDLSLPMWYVYVVGILISCVLCATFFVPFILMNRPWHFDEDIIFITVTIGLVLIVVHELIHGITWAIYAKDGFKSIGFGFSLKAFCPYCTCTEPLKKSAYIVGAMMPTVILGFVPCVVSLLQEMNY